MVDTECLLLGFVVTSFVLLLGNVFVFGAYSILGINRGLVTNSLGSITTNKILLTYVPWTVVYVYQLLWVIYVLILTARRRPGDLVIISPLTLGLYILALVLQLIVNTVFLIEVSFTFLLALLIVLFVMLFQSYTSLFEVRFVIAKQNLQKTDSLIRGFVHNGLALYATWAYKSAVLNLKTILITRTNPPLNPSIAEAITIVIFVTVNFLFIITDLTVADRFSRYTLSPYLLRVYVFVFFIDLTNVTGFIIIWALKSTYTLSAFIGKLTIIFLRKKTRPVVPSVPAEKLPYK